MAGVESLPFQVNDGVLFGTVPVRNFGPTRRTRDRLDDVAPANEARGGHPRRRRVEHPITVRRERRRRNDRPVMVGGTVSVMNFALIAFQSSGCAPSYPSAHIPAPASRSVHEVVLAAARPRVVDVELAIGVHAAVGRRAVLATVDGPRDRSVVA